MKKIALKYFVFSQISLLYRGHRERICVSKYIYRKYMRESIPLRPRGNFK